MCRDAALDIWPDGHLICKVPLRSLCSICAASRHVLDDHITKNFYTHSDCFASQSLSSHRVFHLVVTMAGCHRHLSARSYRLSFLLKACSSHRAFNLVVTMAGCHRHLSVRPLGANRKPDRLFLRCVLINCTAFVLFHPIRMAGLRGLCLHLCSNMEGQITEGKDKKLGHSYRLPT